MPIFEEGWRFYGVDLSAVPGVGSSVLGTLMSELGTGSQIKSAFRSAEAFASWLGLCPDNRVSGGRMLKAKTPKVVSRVAAVRRLAAQSLATASHQHGEDYRWMKARLGKAEGLTATAHKLARILYAVITRRVAYNEADAFKQTPATPARRNLQPPKASRQIRSPTPSRLLTQLLVIQEATLGCISWWWVLLKMREPRCAQIKPQNKFVTIDVNRVGIYSFH